MHSHTCRGTLTVNQSFERHKIIQIHSLSIACENIRFSSLFASGENVPSGEEFVRKWNKNRKFLVRDAADCFRFWTKVDFLQIFEYVCLIFYAVTFWARSEWRIFRHCSDVLGFLTILIWCSFPYFLYVLPLHIPQLLLQFMCIQVTLFPEMHWFCKAHEGQSTTFVSLQSVKNNNNNNNINNTTTVYFL